MAAPEDTWVVTKPEVSEQFKKGVHLQSDGWDCPKIYRNKYKYIPDRNVFGESEIDLVMSNFKVNTLIHATTPEAAVAIMIDGFKPNAKALGPEFPEGMNSFIWWGISPDKNDTETYSDLCEQFTKEFMMKTNDIALPDGKSNAYEVQHLTITEEENQGDSLAAGLSALNIQDEVRNERLQEFKEELNKNFCSSPPFCVTSRYGNVIFEFNIDQLLKAYSSQFCKYREPEFLVLGTFAYPQEVMHTIIVCPPDMTELTKHLPSMDNSYSVIYKFFDNWVWGPETTGSHKNYYHTYFKNIEYKEYRRWEHATFAFYVPDNGQTFKLDNLDMHMTYCAPSKLFRLHAPAYDRNKWTICKTLKFFQDEHMASSNFLLGFIHRFLVNNWKKEDKQKEGDDWRGYTKLKPTYIERLLGWFAVGDTADEYNPDQLLEMVKDPDKCTECWQRWIRRMTHMETESVKQRAYDPKE